MSGMWTKMMKILASKGAGDSSSPSSQHSPRGPKQPDSRSPSSPARFSRGHSSGGRLSKKTCAICLGNVRNGQGQAIFTAECSHSFHFSCIANSVNHGHYLCPICRCKWKEISFQMPTAIPGQAPVSPHQTPEEDINPAWPHLASPFPEDPSRYYSDDEPLLVIPTDDSHPSAPVHNVSVKAVPEFSAVASQESISEFAVLVGVRGPTLSNDSHRLERSPIDLVAVLDASGSMAGSKLSLLKRAVHFVIENLRPADRLSIVSFSASSRRVLPLRRMTHLGREDAKLAVDSLSCNGGTNIVEGLKRGARVLEERSERNPVASIILLSDGIDTYNGHHDRNNQSSSGPTPARGYLSLLPVSIMIDRSGVLEYGGPGRNFPVHTFGFGSDHDSVTLHAISDASGGTFSFIESVGLVQDAFARCIGGLLSVVAHELRLTMTSTLKIGYIPSGRYASEISEDRLQGVITIGDLYADEEKQFLVYMSVPVCPTTIEGHGRTSLLNIACSYRDTTKAMVKSEGVTVEIRRPGILSSEDRTVSLEVDRQKVRLSVVQAIVDAKEMAEMGLLERARDLLTNANSVLLSSASARAGDGICSQLEAELSEITRRMASTEMYENAGRAYVLSGLSSHSSQRSTTRPGGSGPVGYDTPSMVTMVSRSQALSAEYYYREQARERGNRLSRSTS